jgi:DNA-binding winged helix-turn-helix (wHTH) protein
MGVSESQVYRFGAFRIELGTRSLISHDQLVALTPKAFDLLLYMARNSGRLLTKEELLGAVWPDSIVEEGNLSQNVFLLRKALAETGKENRYILTIPGRGYQFAAPMETEAPLVVLQAGHTRTTAVVEEEYFDSIPNQLPAPRSRWKRRIWVGSAALAAMAGAIAIAYRSAIRLPIRGGRQEIVVADFVNHGKDPVFDLTLRKALEIELGQSPSRRLKRRQRRRRTFCIRSTGPRSRCVDNWGNRCAPSSSSMCPSTRRPPSHSMLWWLIQRPMRFCHRPKLAIRFPCSIGPSNWIRISRWLIPAGEACCTTSKRQNGH